MSDPADLDTLIRAHSDALSEVDRTAAAYIAGRDRILAAIDKLKSDVEESDKKFREIREKVAATPKQDTAAQETAAQETATEETAAPETAAQEPPAEETAVQETAAPETVAEETVTEETAAPETVAQATAAQATAAQHATTTSPT